MASDPIGSALGSIADGILGEGGDGSGDILGSVLGDSVGGGFDPESMAVDVIGKLLGLNETDLGIAKAALGAVTGDPMAIAAGVEDTVKGLASGQSPFDLPGTKTDDDSSTKAAQAGGHKSDAAPTTDDPNDPDDVSEDDGETDLASDDDVGVA